MATQATTQPTVQPLLCPYCGHHGYITDVHIQPAAGSTLGVDVMIQCLEYPDHQWHVGVAGVVGPSRLVEETALIIGPIIHPPA